MAGLDRLPCDVDPTCKYFETGCFEDTHHLYPNGAARTCIEMVFRELPENKIRTCRAVHELLEREVGWLEYPPVSEMRVAINGADIYLSKTKQRRVNGHE